MKKNLLLAILMLVLQALVFAVSFWLTVVLYKNCSLVDGQLLEWQCSDSTNPSVIPLVLAFAAPPLLARIVIVRAALSVSWKRLMIVHVAAVLLIFGMLTYATSFDCACGGA